jgi:hypothetical protein
LAPAARSPACGSMSACARLGEEEEEEQVECAFAFARAVLPFQGAPKAHERLRHRRMDAA